MKSKLYQKLLVVAVLLACVMAACSKMDGTYKDFLKGGSIIYPGRADSLRLYPGHNRIKITWLLTSDRSIVLCKVYWNNKADSVSVPVARGKNVDTVSVTIDSLAEGYYNFEIYTYDKAGNVSVPTDTIGQVFGKTYAASLHSRIVKKMYWSQDTAFVFWYDSPKGALGTKVDYIDTNGVFHTIRVTATDTAVVLPAYKLHNTFKYRTGYLPDSMAIDTFYTPFDSAKVDIVLAPKNVNLALHKSIANESSGCGCGPATNLTDGDESSFWQPNSSDRKDDKIVWATIDLGSSKTFNEVKQFWTHGHQHIDSFTVLYSDDNSNWKVAAAVSATPDAGENKTDFVAVKGRYVKLELHFATDGNVNISEIEVYNQPRTASKNLALNKTIADKSSDGSSGRATNLIDGNNNTYWQPLSGDRKDDKMVSADIDLGSSQIFDEVDQYWTHGHQHIDSYTILYSDDNSTWKTAYYSTSGPDKGANPATFAAVTARYVKVELHFATDGNVNIGEISVWYK